MIKKLCLPHHTPDPEEDNLDNKPQAYGGTYVAYGLYACLGENSPRTLTVWSYAGRHQAKRTPTQKHSLPLSLARALSQSGPVIFPQYNKTSHGYQYKKQDLPSAMGDHAQGSRTSNFVSPSPNPTENREREMEKRRSGRGGPEA